ncbi:hypothetical protein [Paraburkholderia sp. J10-1]|uniref:DUF4376 domain-containing protein n=1 Tax=Paraburkholderia sp. J10-1 TaxID=2805430 RepID=UPI002AB79AFE|nr:hypothetical protein [Paraburkholderia sp. J10-1]
MSSGNYVWSAKNNAFYPAAFRSDYVTAQSWPEDGVPVDDRVFDRYGRSQAPPGKTRGVDARGMPAWVKDVTPATPGARHASAIARGLVVTCAATPALNGRYSVGDVDMTNIVHEAQFIALYQEFASGEPTLAWADAGGQLHTFPDTATFLAFAKAAAKYVSACRQALMALQAGNSAAFPSNAVRL